MIQLKQSLETLASPEPAEHPFLRELAEARAGDGIVIVALGASVTEGATALGEFAGDQVYHQRFKRVLEAAFPSVRFTMINAGIGGQRAADGLARLDRDVVPHRPDLVLIDFTLNDALGGLDYLPTYRQAMASLIRQARAKTGAQIIVLTPTFLCTRDGGRAPAEYRHLVEPMIALQRGGVVDAYVRTLRETAAAEGAAVADVYAAWEAMARRGVDITDLLANGLNHPTAEAHSVLCEQLLACLGMEVPSWR